MNKKRFYIISSTLLLIGLFAGVVQYIGVLDTIYAAINNPGHSWSEMDCDDTLCITENKNIGVGTMTPSQKLEINGSVKMNEVCLGGKCMDYFPDLSKIELVADALMAGEEGNSLVMGENGPIWVTDLSYKSSTGSGKNSNDCDQIGGTPYDTGDGIICRYSGSTVPSGWYQAENWQRYVGPATWGGDQCGYHLSSAPLNFENTPAYTYVAGDFLTSTWSCGRMERWTQNYDTYKVHTIINPSTNRVEIGIY